MRDDSGGVPVAPIREQIATIINGGSVPMPMDAEAMSADPMRYNMVKRIWEKADAILQLYTQSNAPRTQEEGSEVQRLRLVLERERSAACHWIEAATRTLDAHSWVTKTRGSYEWDDDEFFKEALHLYKALRGVLDRAAVETGARDLNDCPQTTAEVREARSALSQAATTQEGR